MPAAKLGLGYQAKYVKRLSDLVGPSFTKEIFFTARLFDAVEAREMGLVNRVVPADELDAYVADYAERITANAPLTILALKAAVGELGKDAEDRDMARCDAHGRRLFQEPGLRRRPPRLPGETQT